MAGIEGSTTRPAGQEKLMTARNGATELHPFEATRSCEKGASLPAVDVSFGRTSEAPSMVPSDGSAVTSLYSCGLSVRAVNVLKLLAAEITGDSPPRENWSPPNTLLRKLTAKRLLTARNCGPQTTDEIIQWAKSRGITIQPLFHTGKSLSDVWQDLSTKFVAGEFPKAEVAEALERSVRRKSTKIPILVQKILLKFLSTAGE
jgi:hypothetical protein